MIIKKVPQNEILQWVISQIERGYTEWSDEDIAQATGYSTQTVFKSIKLLAMLDWIDVTRCCGRKSVYQLGRLGKNG